MKIYLGTDHAGFELKEQIKKYLIEEKYDVVDCGNQVFNPNDDYPDFIKIAAENVAKDDSSYGIVFGKSGAGECMVANKIKKIRSILGFNIENVKLAREHNNANILCLGSQFIDFEQAKTLINIFLKTIFSNEERHLRRIKKIADIETSLITQ
jgi:ribose 5-phosphate isomerase B